MSGTAASEFYDENTSKTRSWGGYIMLQIDCLGIHSSPVLLSWCENWWTCTKHIRRIRRPAGVSDWKVLFLFLFLVCTCFCSWLVLVPLFSCCACLLRLNQGHPPHYYYHYYHSYSYSYSYAYSDAYSDSDSSTPSSLLPQVLHW